MRQLLSTLLCFLLFQQSLSVLPRNDRGVYPPTPGLSNQEGQIPKSELFNYLQYTSYLLETQLNLKSSRIEHAYTFSGFSGNLQRKKMVFFCETAEGVKVVGIDVLVGGDDSPQKFLGVFMTDSVDELGASLDLETKMKFLKNKFETFKTQKKKNEERAKPSNPPAPKPKKDNFQTVDSPEGKVESEWLAYLPLNDTPAASPPEEEIPAAKIESQSKNPSNYEIPLCRGNESYSVELNSCVKDFHDDLPASSDRSSGPTLSYQTNDRDKQPISNEQTNSSEGKRPTKNTQPSDPNSPDFKDEQSSSKATDRSNSESRSEGQSKANKLPEIKEEHKRLSDEKDDGKKSDSSTHQEKEIELGVFSILDRTDIQLEPLNLTPISIDNDQTLEKASESSSNSAQNQTFSGQKEVVPDGKSPVISEDEKAAPVEQSPVASHDHVISSSETRNRPSNFTCFSPDKTDGDFFSNEYFPSEPKIITKKIKKSELEIPCLELYGTRKMIKIPTLVDGVIVGVSSLVDEELTNPITKDNWADG